MKINKQRPYPIWPGSLPPVLLHPALTLLLLLALVAGCTRQSPAEQATALATSITQIRAQLPADPTAEQAGKIAKSATRADKAYARLQKLQEENPNETTITAARAQAEPLYAEVRHLRRLAIERHDLADLMGSLKIRGYRAARTVLIPKLLASLAASARMAAETDFAELPSIVRETAELAARLTNVHPSTTGTTPIKLSPADWRKTAECIETWNTNEPAEFPLGLSIAYTLLGKTGFALVELERANTAKFTEPGHAALVPLIRAVVFSRLGFVELAVVEASHISGDMASGPQLLATVHAILAYYYASEKDWKQMDRELGQAVRIWPNNPLIIFLSGERLLADGRKEQALETFNQVTTGTDGAWIAPLLEKRVREVRDSKGEVPPLLLDNDFIVKAALHMLIQQAQQSETSRKLADFLTSAQLLPAAMGDANK